MKPIRAILYRGLLGWFYSGGLYDLSKELNARGDIEADVWSFTSKSWAVRTALAAHHKGQQLAFIGHSMGADAAVESAKRLHAYGVPVRFLGCLDPTEFGLPLMPPNVNRAVCVTGQTSALGGGALEPEFRADRKKIKQVYVGDIHVRIDNAKHVHDLIVNSV